MCHSDGGTELASDNMVCSQRRHLLRVRMSNGLHRIRAAGKYIIAVILNSSRMVNADFVASDLNQLKTAWGSCRNEAANGDCENIQFSHG